MRELLCRLMYRSETLGMKREKKNKLDVSEMQCLRSMCRVTRWNRMRNVAVREREWVYKRKRVN